MDRSVGHRGISRTGEQRCRSCVGSCTAGSSSRRAATDRGLWWRAVNERLLRDGCESVALTGHLPGPPTSPTVELWMRFIRRPTGRTWYRAHNASVVTAYLEHREPAEAENAAERFFMNVVLCRVLYAHALNAAPDLSLGWLRPLGPLLGDPRLGMTGIFLHLSRVLPMRTRSPAM